MKSCTRPMIAAPWKRYGSDDGMSKSNKAMSKLMARKMVMPRTMKNSGSSAVFHPALILSTSARPENVA